MFLATTLLKNVASPWSSIGSHSSSMSLTAWHSPLRRWDCEWGGGETWEDLSSPESLALDIPDPGEDGVEHEGHAMGIPRFLYFEGKFAWAWFPELPNPKLLLQQLQVCGRHYNCQPYYYSLSLYSTGLSTTPDVQFLHLPTEKNQLLGPHKWYWAEILGMHSTSLNLIFEPVLVNPIGSSNWQM